MRNLLLVRTSHGGGGRARTGYTECSGGPTRARAARRRAIALALVELERPRAAACASARARRSARPPRGRAARPRGARAGPSAPRAAPPRGRASSACSASPRAREEPRPHAAPHDLRDDVLRSAAMRSLSAAQLVGLLGAVLRVDRLGEQRRRGRQQLALAHPLELLVARTQPRLGLVRAGRPAARRALRGARRPTPSGRARRGSRCPRAISSRARSKSPGHRVQQRRAGAASRRRRPGCCATCSRICVQRADRLGHRRRARAPPPTRASRGCRTARARRPRGARASPRAATPRRPAPASPSIQSIHARSRQARHWPRSSPCRSRCASADVRDVARLLVPAARPRMQAHELLVDAGARLEARIALEHRPFDRLREELGRRPSSRPASTSAAPSADRSSGRPGSSGPSSAAARSSSRAPAAASPRTSAARAAVASRSAASAASARSRSRGGADLEPQPEGLLEVVAEDLVRDPRLGLQPAREALVQVGTDAAWACRRRRPRGSARARSGTRPHRRTPAGPGGSAACARAPSAAPRWRRAPPAISAATAPRWKRRPSTEACRSTARSSRVEALDARREHGLDAGRQGGRGRAPRRTATSCSRKSGLPSAVSTIRPARVRLQLTGGQRLARRPAPRRRTARSSASSERSGCGAAHAGAALEQLRAREAEQQERRSAREGGDVLEQVEQRGLGPVRVLDHHHERPPRAPPPRAAGGRPRTSRRPAPTRRRARSRPGRAGRSTPASSSPSTRSSAIPVSGSPPDSWSTISASGR